MGLGESTLNGEGDGTGCGDVVCWKTNLALASSSEREPWKLIRRSFNGSRTTIHSNFPSERDSYKVDLQEDCGEESE